MPGRSALKHVPRVMECRNHPLTAHASIVNRVFVMPMSTRKKDMDNAYQWEVKEGVPRGVEEQWVQQGARYIVIIISVLTSYHTGWLKLSPGDFVFVREDTTKPDVVSTAARPTKSVRPSEDSYMEPTKDDDGDNSDGLGEEYDGEHTAREDIIAACVAGW